MLITEQGRRVSWEESVAAPALSPQFHITSGTTLFPSVHRAKGRFCASTCADWWKEPRRCPTRHTAEKLVPQRQIKGLQRSAQTWPDPGRS